MWDGCEHPKIPIRTSPLIKAGFGRSQPTQIWQYKGSAWGSPLRHLHLLVVSFRMLLLHKKIASSFPSFSLKFIRDVGLFQRRDPAPEHHFNSRIFHEL